MGSLGRSSSRGGHEKSGVIPGKPAHRAPLLVPHEGTCLIRIIIPSSTKRGKFPENSIGVCDEKCRAVARESGVDKTSEMWLGLWKIMWKKRKCLNVDVGGWCGT